jgi:hypothetical protein
MKRIFLAGTGFLLVSAASPALAQSCTTVGAQTFCDPASFHVTDSKATGSDPVLLNENTTFNIDDVDNGATINKPLTIFFAVPVGAGTPVVTSDSFDGATQQAFTGTLSNEGVWNPATNDLYSFLGCAACDNSINMTNVDAVDGAGATFNVFNLVVNETFAGNTDFETVDGLFPKGTIIAPLASDVGDNKTTFYDTAWTNAGFVNAAAVGGVPEPKTWAMMALGFGLMGLLGYKRRHNRLAFMG